MSSPARAIVIFGLMVLFPFRVGAVSVIDQLDPHHPDDNFRIKSGKTAQGMVRFLVTIQKAALVSSSFDGYLEVVDDDGKEISISAGEEGQDDKSITYRFEVSSKYLEKSRFNFQNGVESNGKPMPAMVEHWFYLKDFAAAADIDAGR